MTLADLLEHLERRRADAAEMGTLVPEERLLAYVVDRLRAAVDGEPSSAPRQSTPEDRLLSAEQVAERMDVSKGYVYAHANEWPFTRRLSDTVVRFSAAGLARWMAQGDRL